MAVWIDCISFLTTTRHFIDRTHATAIDHCRGPFGATAISPSPYDVLFSYADELSASESLACLDVGLYDVVDSTARFRNEEAPLTARSHEMYDLA
jgi:hypothetical protein